MSATTGAATDALSKVFKENEALLQDFVGLVITLLHESHQSGGKYWEYMCSLPLHVPLRKSHSTLGCVF